MKGSVHRVIFHDKTSCLDGEIQSEAVRGTDMSGHRIVPASPSVKALSPKVQPRGETSIERRFSMTTPIRAPRPKAAENVPSVPELGPPLFTPSSQVSPSLLELLSRSTFKQKH